MEKYDLIQAIVMCIPILFLLMGRTKAQYAKGFKMAGVWLLILVAVMGAAMYWPEFKNSKFYASLVPGEPVIGEGGEMTFIKGDDGHFHINATVNGRNIKFMVDTGASSIVLSREDAEKIGIDISSLKYDRMFSTANGMTRGASVNLPYLVIGGLKMHDVPASVNEGELEGSLLGMQMLDQFKSYRIEANKLTISR